MIVINNKSGEFGISSEALIRLVELNASCIEAIPIKDFYKSGEEKIFYEDYVIPLRDGFLRHRFSENVAKDDVLYFLSSDLETRENQTLISVIQELGKNANGWNCELKIVNKDESENSVKPDFSISSINGKEKVKKNNVSNL